MLLAYIDESGITPHGERTSEHFVLSAVVFDEVDGDKADLLNAHLRLNTGSPSERKKLHFSEISNHGARRYMSHTLGTRPWLDVISVVVCKRQLASSEHKLIEDVPAQYNYTFRYLLERLSWLARSRKTTLRYTAAALKYSPPDALAAHETALRRLGAATQIKWQSLENPAGMVVHADSDRRLDLADLAASATARAFEPDEWGLTESLYLRNLAPALYRYNDSYASYGLKLHPTTSAALPAYAWALDMPNAPADTIERRTG